MSCKDKEPVGKDDIKNDKDAATEKLFEVRDANFTNLSFKNNAVETLDENYLNYEFFYNGSGVAVGDLNNDGLADIYFAGNSSDDKLYVNKGNLKFDDISVSSGISKEQGWSTGVTMIDINHDGWLDIYVCRSGPSKDIKKRTNKLYINNKDLTFTEAAAQYGLQSSKYSIQSAFFDYDLDGDLDMYLLNHPEPGFKAKKIPEHMKEIKSGKIQTDVFYENVDGTYVDKSKEANLVNFGYRHGIAIGDINKDGYPDIYVSSDFEEPDVLAINNGDKTFTDKTLEYFDHISYNSMGNEMVDVNNDGLLDVYVVDMATSDHYRSKAYMASMNIPKFKALVANGYHNQYMFNTFHLNQTNNSFSEIAQYSGTAKTDWSWAPLFFDMDLDGDKDLFITNGIKENFLFRDINAELNKRKRAGMQTNLQDLLQIVPSDISENLFYKNKDGAKFENVSGKWALPSLYNSNGVATADFDNDGDLDFVTNNMGTSATLYESLARDQSKHNSIKIILEGSEKNPAAIGAKVEVITNSQPQWQELYNVRGYLSSVDFPLLFGIGSYTNATAKVIWPDGKESLVENLKINDNNFISYDDASLATKNNTEQNTYVSKVLNSEVGINFEHKEDDFNDYKTQILLPHSQSTVGPCIAKSDVNGDGLEDLFIGAAAGYTSVLYIANKEGGFFVNNNMFSNDKAYEDTGAVFFDSDNDGDMDLYIVSGGAHRPKGDKYYQDRLYINDGVGNFVKAVNAMPNNTTSSQAIAAGDIDNDGDTDLFIGGRIIPDEYPYAPESYFLINNNGKFSEQPVKLDQMVSSALLTDYDVDGDLDLMAVGEWSKINIYNNDNGKFSEASNTSLEATTGLWFGLDEFDIDNDGDMDYFVGNLGLNSKFKATKNKQFHIYSYDFDESGSMDVVLSSNYKGNLVPARGRECSSQQMPFIKEKFGDYRSFASATLEDIYGDDLSLALHYKADILYSVFLENEGNGNFTIKKLPYQTQLSPLSGFEFVDITKDGNPEVITVGNLYNVEVETVRYDASKGAVLSYQNGNFEAINPKETGFLNNKDARKITSFNNGDSHYLIVVNNDAKPEIFRIN